MTNLEQSRNQILDKIVFKNYIFINRFFNKQDFSSKRTIFIISFTFSLEIINAETSKAKSKEQYDLNIFLWIAASITDAAVANPNAIKTLLANG